MSLKSSNKVDTNRYELAIAIDAETFANAVMKVYRKNVKDITVPGFRKGKAPKSIIEKMYGENVFYEDALNELYGPAIDEAAEAAGVEIVDTKNIDFDLKTIGKEGVEFTVKVTVKPEVEIGEYKGLKAEKPACEATDADIDAEINMMRERASRMVTVEDRAAAMDDIVVFDFDGYVDGVAFEGGKAESYSLKLGSGQFIPGFEEQIVGKNTNDEFDVNVTFPEDYHSEELKGKPAVFKCKLHEIKVRELPEVDDEFVKDVSEFDTVDALKEDLKAKITERKEKQADNDVEGQLIDALIEGLKAEIPEAMIENRIDDNIRDFDYNLQMQGLNLQQYMQYMGADMASIRENYKAQAEKQVKVRLALEKVAELENIQPTTEELDAEYAKFVDAYKLDVAQIKAAIPEKEVMKDLAVQKAVEIIKESAVVTAAKAKKAPAKKTAAKKTTAKKEAVEE
ncbi:MAG: trigger factor [Clostridia bacterium]|nr:trigger factor [Clostridia bacterium]